ncbi:BMP family ABC transporter substrate-binding protein [Jatrophihabitans endophyticus]|uniref:BMP family ABC transporter substrate-binding protein n=1 Tax=Jatrophihabitans endophyticus TaxID=1206085 RepID=UPI00190E9E61|nr:BMP family ABC transporter substrate-binding protein [Jatrophihabitans endophyticus]
MSALSLGLSACAKTDSGDDSSDSQKPAVMWVDSDGCTTAKQYCNVFLTTVLKNDKQAVQLAVENASAGIFPKVDTVGDLKNGGTGLASYHQFDGKVDDSLKSEVNKVKADIIAGKITITSKAQPKGKTELTPPSSGKTDASFSACMVTDTGGIDDKSFNAASWSGMQAAQTAGKAKVQYVSSKTQADYAPNIRALVNKGCKLIVGVGGLMGEAINNAAKANPKLHFALVDGAGNGSNVQGLQINTAQSGFLGGYLAAGYSKSGKVATYGGLAIAPVTVYMDGFYEGVQYYNKQKSKKVQVLGWNESTQKGTFAGSFTDQGKGQQITQNFIQQGADVIFPVAGGTGLGSAAAAQAAK